MNPIFKAFNLFVKIPRPEDSEGIFYSLCQAATCYYQSNRSKVETIPLSALHEATTSELSYNISLMLNVKQ